MDMEKMGLLISKLRKEKGLTQKELADKLHITDRAVSKWERGLSCPDISLLTSLALILDVSVTKLLNGDDKADTVELVNKTINYAKETRDKIKKEKTNKLFLTAISFLLLIILLNFIKVESRFLKKYNSRDISMFEINLDMDNDNNYQNVFDEIETRSLKINSDSGIYQPDDYAIIKEYVNDILDEVNKNKEKYYQKSYSFKELKEISQSNLVEISSFDYYPTIENILLKYQKDYVLNYSSETFYHYKNLLFQYVNDSFQFELSQKLDYLSVGNVALYIQKQKYDYYANALEDIMKVGEINEI